MPVTHQRRENIQIASSAKATRKELRERGGASVKLAGKERLRILGNGIGRQSRGGMKLGEAGGRVGGCEEGLRRLPLQAHWPLTL